MHLDQGIATDHPELKGIASQVPYDNGLSGDHGTHVAGIIGAAANNQTGIAGMNWNASILGYNCFDFGEELTTSTKIVNGMITLVESGAKVINVSLGSSSEVLDSHTDVLSREIIDQNADYVSYNMGLLLDKGYVDFWRLYNYFQLRQAYFVTRAKDNMRFEVVGDREVDMHAGLISDQSIRLTGPLVSKDYPERMRMVVYEDFATNNVYRFLTNNFLIDALTVAELYRERWQIEMFFKWIKQHLRIKSFFGTTRNAVFAQIWIAICDYLLLIIARKMFHIEQNLYIFSQAIGLVLFEKIPVSELFNRIDNSKLEIENDGQGWLF